MGRLATDKRERLVAAAIERFHQQGYARTSLADVAETAGMSAGNVFYYFKAKDDLARAVVDEWCRQISGFMASFNAEPNAWLRLNRFIKQAGVLREMYVTLGCPLAGLSRDLRRDATGLQAQLPRIYAVQYDWIIAQFTELGFPSKEAKEHGRFLMAGFHGAILLAYAQNDDTLILSEVASLTTWLHQVQASKSSRRAGRRIS